jgi:hypothetical protein
MRVCHVMPSVLHSTARAFATFDIRTVVSLGPNTYSISRSYKTASFGSLAEMNREADSKTDQRP